MESALYDMLASVRAAAPGWTLHLIVPDEGALAARAREIGVGVSVLPFPGSLARLGDAGAVGAPRAGIDRLRLLAKLASSSATTARYAWRLRRLLKSLAPDIVHTHGLKTHVLGAWARPAGAAVVWHVHDYAGRRPVMSRLLRLSARRAAAAVANSRSVAADVRAVCGNRLDVRTVYNGVDLGRFAPAGARADLDALAGLPPAEEGTLRVGLVATLARWKGHRTFLEALSLLPAGARVRGYVAGGAVYRTDGSQHRPEELREMARALGVEGRVGFTGLVGEAAEAMRALDVVVHCSTEPEPFGLVIAEAMACGRAVVASRAGGAAEIFSDGADALSHAPGDAAALAGRIAQLASDPGLRARLGRAARETAARRFDRARLARELIPLYRELHEDKRSDECGMMNDEYDVA
ncbi:MAG TPA: glycosyltransferase family 4 protein [Pyrinomonadaceae bacterium]|nr:glycosyltransferase family 4 protein [Pyrinomonadaceae bacterium]